MTPQSREISKEMKNQKIQISKHKTMIFQYLIVIFLMPQKGSEQILITLSSTSSKVASNSAQWLWMGDAGWAAYDQTLTDKLEAQYQVWQS